MPTDKPMLTASELQVLREHVDNDGCFVDLDLDKIANAIDRAAALLRRAC